VGETEATYLTVADLQYQVQLSRQLNPFDIEDRDYLHGLPAGEAKLAPNQAWFAVFMRVENPLHDRALVPTTQFEIVDTQHTRYTPVALGRSNLYGYVPRPIAPEGRLPDLNSTAGFAPTQGALVLFKVDRKSYENRPLELEISAPGAQTARVSLDV
jgi:hypothetical protein